MKYFRSRLCRETRDSHETLAAASHNDPIGLAQIMREAARTWEAPSTLDDIVGAMLKRHTFFEFKKKKGMYLEFDYPEEIVIKIE